MMPFDEFFRAEYAAVVRVGWSLTGRLGLAEELAQESFLAAHRRWATVSRYDDPAAWVRRVMINRSLSSVRRASAEARTLLRMSTERGTADHDQPDPDDDVWRALRDLPRRQAEVMVLVIVDDMKVADVARVLDCGEETVRTHLRRARLALAAALGEAEACEPLGTTTREGADESR